MRSIAALVPVLLVGAVVLFFGYAAFDGAGDVDFDGSWSPGYVVAAGVIVDAVGIAIMVGALQLLRTDTTGRWSLLFLAEAALATLPFPRFLGSNWGLLITAALVACASTALVRAAQSRRS